ncbi:MAG: Zn-dependent exopeptidase M28 [bacterium]|nr:Zn-dependent exopeptidase M28 [bacterium]
MNRSSAAGSMEQDGRGVLGCLAVAVMVPTKGRGESIDDPTRNDDFAKPIQRSDAMDTKRTVRIRIGALAWGLAVCFPVCAWASLEGEFAANQVSQSNYRDILDNWLYTHAGDNRGFGPEHDLARDNIVALFQSHGLTVALEPFTYQSVTYYNVVATHTGTVYPNQMYVVGAHFDSVNNPGADDDASGVALLLEAARVISQYDSDYTIRYIAFDREEQGLIGSNAYVNNHAGDQILGMVQADMVAYDPGTDHALIYGRSTSNAIKTALGSAHVTYSGGMTWTDAGWISASDHAPFDAAGYQACLLIEGETWSNPYYHTQQDSVDQPGNINYAYATKMTRSVVGYLVDEAGVDVPIDALTFAYPAGRPEAVSPDGGTVMRVEVGGLGLEVPQPGTGVLHYDVGNGWESAFMNVVADNVYDAVFPAAACGQKVQYYVSAEALGGQVYTDPYDAPTTSHSVVASYGNVVAFKATLDTIPFGWSMEDQWAIGQPTGGGGQHGGPDPTSGHTGINVFGYNLSGDYPNNLPERHLTSTDIDCTGLFNVRLNFWRWLGVESPDFDHAYVRASNDGVNWTTVWQNSSEIADVSWTEMDLDISGVADDEPTVYLRWTLGTTDAGWQYCGWNIDDIRLTAAECQGQANGDWDADGDVDLYDFAELQVCYYGSGTPYPVSYGCEAFDFDIDGDVDMLDCDEFHQRLVGPLQ